VCSVVVHGSIRGTKKTQFIGVTYGTCPTFSNTETAALAGMSLTPRRGTLAGAKAAPPATQARPRTTVRMVIKEGMPGNSRAASLYFQCPNPMPQLDSTKLPIKSATIQTKSFFATLEFSVYNLIHILVLKYLVFTLIISVDLVHHMIQLVRCRGSKSTLLGVCRPAFYTLP